MLAFMPAISVALMLILALSTAAQVMGRRYHTAVMCGIGVLGWIGVLYFSLSKLLGQ